MTLTPALTGALTRRRLVVTALALSFLIPLLIYGILPLLGMSVLAGKLNLMRLLQLLGLAVAGLGYFCYWQFVIRRPQLIIMFMVVAWTAVEYLGLQLLEVGINIHMRPLFLMTVAAPAGWLAICHARPLLTRLPHLKYYLAFFLWLTGYFFFYNARARDPLFDTADGFISEGSIAFIMLTAYMYCLLGGALGGVTMQRLRNPTGFFDVLNKALLVFVAFHSVLTILGYPFGWFCVPLDGFTRALGLFTHPNPFAHHMGMVLVYLLGLFCYYQGIHEHRMPKWLLWGTIGLALVAFMLGLSKTAIGALCLCAITLALLNFQVPIIQRRLLIIVPALIVLVPVGMWLYAAVTDVSFMDILQRRMNEGSSYEWRTNVWKDLMANIDMQSIWLGHGFTSSNAAVFQYTFNDATNAKPLMMVHNGYIGLLYDLGLPGYLLFLAAFVMLARSLYTSLSTIREEWRTLHSIVVAMTLYFLVVCAFDEMAYMFNAPLIFWTLSAMIITLVQRERGQMA